MKYGAIILSAGSGTRFGAKKQYIELNGVPIWQIVQSKAIQVVPAENVVVVGIDIPGGNTRSESVRIGLNALSADTERTIILEAARPLVTVEQIIQLLQCDAPSATFVMPLVNTVIFRNGTYVNRNDLYEMLTPQAFDYRLLKRAYDQLISPDYTDETRIMYEVYGIQPCFIETTQNLHKITYQRDISILMEIDKMMKEGTLK